MSKTDKKIEEQIIKIQKKYFYFTEDYDHEMLATIDMEDANNMIKDLSNLLTKSNEEAVKNTILSIMSKVPTIMPHDKPDYILRSDFDRAIKETEKQFLTQQSLYKGDKR